MKRIIQRLAGKSFLVHEITAKTENHPPCINLSEILSESPSCDRSSVFIWLFDTDPGTKHSQFWASSGCPAKAAIVRSRRPWRYFPSAISTASSASRMSFCPPFKIFDVRISSPSHGYSISTKDDWNDSSSYRGAFPTTVPSIYESGKSDGLLEDSGSSESERRDSVWAIYCFA